MTTVEIIGAAVALLGVAGQGGIFAFMLGKHSQRLATVEKETADLKTKTEAHGVALGALDGMVKLLDEVRADVKRLLAGSSRRSQGQGN